MQNDYYLEDSGTYNLAGSYNGSYHPVPSFGRDEIGMPEARQRIPNNYSPVKPVLESPPKPEKGFDRFTRALNETEDPMLSSSGRFGLIEPDSGSKFARINHFQNEENLQVNLSNSMKERERKFVQDIIRQERARQKEEEEKEAQLIERLTANANKAKASLEPKDEADTKSSQPKPDYPQFEEQIKQLREGYAKEYQEKINRGLKELDDLKKDIAINQEVYETQQIKDLKRQI